MISRVHSFVLDGIDAAPCEIEVHVHAGGMSRTDVVGLPDAAVRESIQRVRAAIVNSGYAPPSGRLTINLAPANVRKEGPVYDLPIAIALLQAGGTIERPAPGRPRIEDYLVAGELALDGRLRPVRSAISLGQLAAGLGKLGVIVPAVNAGEAAAVEGIESRGAATLAQVVCMFNGAEEVVAHPRVDVAALIESAPPEVDFGEVRGQEAAKRALTVAAAGAHNVLMLGPAGTGKTMMARALPGILPPLTAREALEVTRIHSSVGRLPRGQPLATRRPVRAPHHTASASAIVGGGSVPRPGDVSLAHRGILFLDELPEFARNVLETLRQPLEDGCVTVARAAGSVRFPARFMLVAALNPTPRGDAAAGEGGRRAMGRYLARLSGPLIDRIDIHVEVPRVPFRHLRAMARGTDTATMRGHVLAARAVQARRQGAATNAELSGRDLDRHAPLDDAAARLLGQAMTELSLSARAYDRIRRVSRTIADLEAAEHVQSHHVAEAVQYRLLDRLL